ncbi:MAG: zinc-ribbon domain-containing protein [Armatimonadota bacterium]
MSADTTRCPHCSTTLPPRARFCYHCGASQPSAGARTPPSLPRLIGAVLLAMLAAVCGIIAAGGALMGGCIVLITAGSGDTRGIGEMVPMLAIAGLAGVLAVVGFLGVIRLLR